MTYPVRHFSASSASTYLQCPAKWEYRYIERIPESKSEALEKGTMVHKALERYWTGDYGKPEQGIHRYISAYRKMAGAVLPEQAQAVELELRANLAGVDVPLLGYIDCYTADGLIVDLKTASKPWWDGRAVKELQPALYTYLARQNGLEVRGFEFHVLVNEVGSHRVEAWQIPVELDEDFIEEHLERVVRAWQGIMAGEFPRRKSPLCGFCDFEFICGIEPGRGAG
jgi:CRISPR/Cas system-associated exonuclease Cas4 (RecB family)